MMSSISGRVRRSDTETPELKGSDRLLIKVVPPVLILALIGVVLLNPTGVADVISTMRTFVTGEFTWFFVVYSLVAVGVCVWLAFDRRVGDIRLGGEGARSEFGNFAWYSMLFACGQGIGLIFWSVAEPIMLREEAPTVTILGSEKSEAGLVWSYFHWGLTAWAMYCVVAVCLAYSHHNLGKPLTFRDATVDILPAATRRPAGVVIELLAIIATVLGLATSFGFASMQFTSGLSAVTGISSSATVWLLVIVGLGAFAALSSFGGLDRGMKRVSEANSILSIVLVIGVFISGPTVYLLSNLLESTGSFIFNFVPMSFFSEGALSQASLDSWKDSWSGWWTVFIWCWVIAFSPFVSGFIARISRGRTIREFVIGVTVVPSVIVMVWIGVIGSAAIYYDNVGSGGVSAAVAADTSSGLFEVLRGLPLVGTLLMIVATLLVATYYVTSLDAGTYALAEFVSAPKQSGPGFRVVLVANIAAVTIVLLTIGGSAVVDTVQTGTIIGSFPFAFVILLMIANFVRRLRALSHGGEQVSDESVTQGQV